MDLLDLTLATPEENLALDEALLLEAEAGKQGEVLRFWEWVPYAVILGSAGRIQEEVHESRCQAEGVPILRRCSGGGTVLLGPGCLVYSLVLSFEHAPALQDVTHSYRYIFERVGRALQEAVLRSAAGQTSDTPPLTQAGSSDLALADGKISGNPQRRMRHHLLHHGTILHGFDSRRIGRYLPLPQRQPAYRRDRAHEHFVTNLPAPVETIKEQLRQAWDADRPRLTWDEDLVRQLVAEKYANPAWTRRR
jgi:lipoate-protein ligase A